MRAFVLVLGLVGTAGPNYRLRFPALTDGARRSVAERFRARNPDLRISRLSIDPFTAENTPHRAFAIQGTAKVDESVACIVTPPGIENCHIDQRKR